jgi:acyl-coenzyme A synthetase/AMP-(fatty) acid ligase
MGTCLALGYYNNPEKTAEAFCQNPLNHAYPERIYRTGDIGKYDADGHLCFVSRKDAQIKHMGHRIELGEIEVAVNALDFVDAGICMYDGEQIYLCYQAESACEKEILKALGKKLPPYMFPTKLVWYEKLPLNAHNKIDRVRLRQEVVGS